MMLPYAIHHYPRGKRIGGINDRVGEIETAAAMGEARRLALTQDGYEMGRRELARVVFIAANPEVLFRELRLVFDDLQEGILFGKGLLIGGEFGVESFETLLPLSRQEAIDFAVAVVEDSLFITEQIFPGDEAIALKRDEIGLTQFPAIGVKAEREVVLFIDEFLFIVDGKDQGLEILGRPGALVGGFGRERGLQIRVIFLWRGAVLFPVFDGFLVELCVRLVARSGQHVIRGV